MRPTVQEIPNPAYQKWQKERRMFVPVKGSIPVTGTRIQPSLSEQEQEGYKRYEVDALLKIREFCDHCTECSDCAYSGEMVAMDRCRVVKKEMKK